MDIKTISLVLSILLAVFLVWGLIWGFIRGFKNTIYRGVFIIVVGIVSFLLASAITSLILNLPLGKLFGLEVAGQNVETLREYVSETIKSELQVTADTKATVDLIIVIISLVLNSIIFLPCFWLLKWILSPVYSILRRLVFDRKRYKKVEVEKRGKTKVKKVKVKSKRYRLLGGLVGVVVGLFVCTFTLMPVVGYLNLVQNVEDTTKKDNKSETGVISDLIGADTYNAISNGYETSVLGGVLKYTGMEFVATAMFDGLSTTTYNKTKISLEDEVSTALETYHAINKTKIPDFDTATQEEVAVFLDNTKIIVNNVFKMGIVNSSIDAIMPVAVDFIKQQDFINQLDNNVDELVVTTLDTLAEFNSTSVKSEILGLISLVETLNDYGLILPVVQNNTGNVIEFLQATTNREVVRDITSKLFALKTVDSVAPSLTNVMLGYVANATNLEYTEIDEITSEQLKTSLENILFTAVDILPYLDSESEYYVTTQAISGVGKVIDAIKNSDFVDETMFDSIISEVQDKLYENTTNIPTWAQNVANEAIANLANVENYTTEFEKIYSIVDNIEKSGKEDSQGNLTYDLEDLNFEKIGVAIDTLEMLKLVERQQNVAGQADNLVIELLLDAINEYSNDESLSLNLNNFTAIAQLKNNILDADNVKWNEELPKMKDLLVHARNIMVDEGSIVEKLKDPAYKESFAKLGKGLDTAKTASLLSNGAVDRKFMIDIMDVVADDYRGDPDMLEAINSMKNNISTAPSICWEVEFANIADLMSIDFDGILSSDTTTTVSNAFIVGQKIDNIVGTSVIITEEIIDKFICTVVSNNFGDTTYGEIVKIVNEAFSDVDLSTLGYQNGIDSYALEFDALNTLYQAKAIVDKPDFDLETHAEELGNKVQEAIDTKITVNEVMYTPKVVNEKLVDIFINEVVDEKFGDSNDDFADTLTEIKDKFSDVDDITEGYQNDIQNYTVEFKALGKLQSIVDEVSANAFDFKTQGGELGKKLDEAVNTTYGGFTTRVVTEKMLDLYIVKLLDEYIDKDNTDADLAITKLAIKNKFKDIDSATVGYQNAVEYYQVEFTALTRLLDVVDVCNASGFDFNNETSRNILGNSLDKAISDVNIGTVENPNSKSTNVVTPAIINPYIQQKIKNIELTTDEDFVKVETTFKNNISSYLDSMETDNTKSYTQCFTAINEMKTIVDNVTETTSGNDWLDVDVLGTIENSINQMQGNVIGGAHFGREVMLVVLDKFEDICRTQLTDAVVDTKVKYINAYRGYLKNPSNVGLDEPYTSETASTTTQRVEVSSDVYENVTVNTNKPLQSLYKVFTQL